MIDYLNFIEELSVVEKLLENEDSSDPVFNIIIAKGIIRDLKRKYEKRVSDFESAYAPKDEDTTSSDVQLSTVSNQIAWHLLRILV